MTHDTFMKILRAQINQMVKEQRALEKQYDRATTMRETRVIERAMSKIDKQMDKIETVVSRLAINNMPSL